MAALAFLLFDVTPARREIPRVCKQGKGITIKVASNIESEALAGLHFEIRNEVVKEIRGIKGERR